MVGGQGGRGELVSLPKQYQNSSYLDSSWNNHKNLDLS